MMRSNICFLIFLLVSSCSINLDIRQIEGQDNQFCSSLGLNKNGNEIESDLYWRCMIKLAQDKITNVALTPKSIQRNSFLKKYIKKLEGNFSVSREKLNNYRNNFIDDIHHEICKNRGFDVNSLDLEIVEKYIKCRNQLILVYQIDPPYKKTLYLKRPQDSYNTGFALNRRIDEKARKLWRERQRYPLCAKYNPRQKDTRKSCMADLARQKICYKEARKKKFLKEIEQRIICQKKLYARFPNSMMKKSDQLTSFERRKIAADIYNNNSFYSLGIDPAMVKKFKSREIVKIEVKEEKKIEKKSDEKKPVKKREFNHEKYLYSKAELTSLRQKFIKACNEDATVAIEKYFTNLNNECDLITKSHKNYEQ